MQKLIAWFVHNPVAANLLMLIVVVGGLVGISTVSKTVFPSAALDSINISVAYLGASPADVEERILIPVEEAISGLQGIKQIRAGGYEGRGSITVDALQGHDVDLLLNEIKARVDAINTFPAQSERPIVRRNYAQSEVMYLLLYGDLPSAELKELGRTVRDKIAAIEDAELTRLEGDLPYEISVEVSDLQLEQYGLTFTDVAQAIRRSSLNVGAGLVEDASGMTQLMTRGQAYQELDFQDIVLSRQADGNQILLRDVATVVDGFSDGEVSLRYHNQPTLLISVVASGEPDVVAISQKVHDLLDTQIRPALPQGVGIDPLIDESDSFRDRLGLLVTNGISGLLLVFVGLALFLTPRLALWVCTGICISFLGCFWLMPYLGVQLSMLSMFSFVLILGIVVDDALIISESIHRQNELGNYGTQGSIAGASMVARPVLFSALTTMLAFSPLLFVQGEARNFVLAIPIVVIVTLGFSLVESYCILPLHLLRKKPAVANQGVAPARVNWFSHQFKKLQHGADSTLRKFITRLYRPFLDRVLRNKTLTVSGFISLCILIISFVAGGWIKFNFEPYVVADFIQVSLQFPSGIPYSVKLETQQQLETAADVLQEELHTQYPDQNLIRGAVTWTTSQNSNVQAFMSMEKGASTIVSTEELARRWRELTGEMPDVRDSSFAFTVNNNESALYLLVAGNDDVQLRDAANTLKQKLAGYQGVYEVVDSNESAITEASLSLFQGAQTLGVSLTDLATQVRQAFYGEEVQRIPRGRDSVKVMVRLPERDRDNFDTLHSLRIRSADGGSVAFGDVADVNFSSGVSQINRTNRARTIRITAKVDAALGNLSDIRNDLNQGYLTSMNAQYPEVSLSWAGNQEGEDEFMSSLLRNAMFALFAIYFLLAVAFRSYVQPLLIMIAIPCGYLGAVVGHLLLGIDMSLYSILGIVAAAGVVVNDNLVLMDYINALREEGHSAIRAIEKAAEDRFRPIFLTSFTTFIGLVPLMSETSVQAQFMIPTVVSLAFGVLFATLVTLVLVPVLYLALSDLNELVKRWFSTEVTLPN